MPLPLITYHITCEMNSEKLNWNDIHNKHYQENLS